MSDPPKYAKNTKVSADRTLFEIDKLLKQYGAIERGQGHSDEANAVAIYFRLGDRQIRFRQPLPSLDDEEIRYVRANQSAWARRERTDAQRQVARDQEIDRRLRSLFACIKAKLIAVADQVETVEQAFMAEIVLANGQTMSEWAAPQIAAMYQSGRMPPLLPGIGPERQLPAPEE